MTRCIFRVFCFFYIILILVFESGSSEICSKAFGANVTSGEALPICSASSRTGHTILIDTALVPFGAAIECNCSVEIDTNVQTVHILYKTVPEWADPVSCGLLLKAVDIVLQCPDRDGSLQKLSFSTPFLLKFSKETVSADACFDLMIDKDATDKSNATVTCFETGDQTTTSRQASGITTPGQNTNKTSYTNSSKTTSSTTTESGLTLITSSKNKPVTITDNSTAVNNALTEVTEEKSNTVVIAAAAGGGGVCLLMISVILIYCYCRRINKKTINKPDYVNTTVTTPETEVTENVLYNMEFPEETKGQNIQLNDLDVTYNTVGEDTYHAVDDNMGTKEKYALSSIKVKSLDNDAGIYNTVEEDKDVETQKDNIQKNANVDTNVDTDPAYNNLELTSDIIAKDNSSSVTQNNDSDITYSVVNKNRCKDPCTSSGYQRPKQLEVADSGDTYAIVEKGSNS